jgi:hypothetical protein
METLQVRIRSWPQARGVHAHTDSRRALAVPVGGPGRDGGG